MLMRCFREFSALCILALEPVIACGMNMDREDGNVHNKSGVYSTGGENTCVCHEIMGMRQIFFALEGKPLPNYDVC